MYLCKVKMALRNIVLIWLMLVTILANGGIHFIVHQCHHSGNHQVCFAVRHGCCQLHDDSSSGHSCCNPGGCAIDLTRDTHFSSKCCSDEVQYLRADASEVIRFQPGLKAVSPPHQCSFDRAWITVAGYCSRTYRDLPYLPDSPQALFCVFRA